MELGQSVVALIKSIQEGREEAVSELWERYYGRLMGVARKQLHDYHPRVADEEDMALSALRTFCRRVEEGRLGDFHSSDDLWRVLLVITKRKAISWVRYELAEKRDQSQVLSGSVVEQVVSGDPTPDQVSELLDEMGHLMDLLRRADETGCLHLVARRKLEGFSTREIAGELQTDVRTVQRRLALIRKLWAGYLVERLDEAS